MAIVSCLVDTNILLRVANRSDPNHAIVEAALTRLIAQDTSLVYTFQNITELWNVMTRPVARNGFGLSGSEVDRLVHAIESHMILLPESEAVYRRWREIVVAYGVAGVQVHDARLAAAMYVNGVEHILTLNIGDFSRFSGLTPLHPAKL